MYDSRDDHVVNMNFPYTLYNTIKYITIEKLNPHSTTDDFDVSIWLS